jgi:ATP-dependent helicase/nuclease subunit A
MARRHSPAPDQAERDRAVHERARNVLIDAGAGTGKTAILVDRLVEMVAPSGGAAARPIERLAAITFTRKAAGELRLRIRERLLEELAEPALDPVREGRLRDALAGLDIAHVGTIHAFADRLLRLRPVEAALSPSYDIVEDGDDLVHETFERLLQGAQNGTLEADLAGTAAAARAAEATRTVLFALDAGLRAQSQDLEYTTLHGLDALVAGFIAGRDVPPPDAEAADFDRAAFRAVAEQVVRVAASVTGGSPGGRWIARLVSTARRLRDEPEPYLVVRGLRRVRGARPPEATRKHTFAGDDHAWKTWKLLTERDDAAEPLLDRLCAAPNRWLGTRLARLFPVVVALHEKVKARRRVLDQLDLLLKLRDLLRDDRDVRADYQALFDHVLVDEFQDTDPLQAEIVLFLCEDGARAPRWDEVRLRDGALTLVGDPKQSIYRFRRADVLMYDRVREVVARSAHLPVTLSANFRSLPSLVDWLNDRFDRVLGQAPDGRRFDRETGRVYNARLAPGRAGGGAPAVHVLPFEVEEGGRRVDDYRRLEGRALARYLRWLVEAGDVTIDDPVTGERRRPRHGDIAVLAVSTWRLSLLLPSLDAAGLPWAVRGGSLFLADPLHRQFLLGLRAVADPHDGVAEAALLRPPFFALDLADLVRDRQARRAGADGSTTGVADARALVRELRRRRFDRSPGATARDLLERTALARTVALGPNGAERLTRLRELCLLLAEVAAADGLDYDAATARVRRWVEEPIQLDPPHPVGTEAVHVLTVHQAKGLEFPVVVLWDGKGRWDARLQPAPWRMERDGRGWLMSLEGLGCEEPAGLALRETEKSYLDWERRRVVYVACTRARNLLVLPCAGTARSARDRETLICGELLEAAPAGLVRELECYRDRSEAAWVRALPAPAAAAPRDTDALEREVAARWTSAASEAGRPRFSPASVTGLARAGARAEVHDAVTDEGAAGDPAVLQPRESRFGPVFGTTVHHAIGLCLRDHGLDPAEAVRQAARRFGLAEHLDDAAGDVQRTLATLRAEGVFRRPGPDLQLEYPVAGVTGDGHLVSGYIDLVAVHGDEIIVVDFKTDVPSPAARVRYAGQLAQYVRLLRTGGVARVRQRTGLLFTQDGSLRWETALPAIGGGSGDP